MPLHDWNEWKSWDGVHHLWITELFRSIKPRLPEGYRAYIGSAPLLAVDEPEGTPDVSVRSHPAPRVPPPEARPGSENDPGVEPDQEVAVASISPTRSIFISREGWLVAAVELVSPRNKDRPSARTFYTSRYASYLIGGIHLVLIDVHPRPYAFSFADAIAQELQMNRPRCPSPLAIAYRVGEPLPEGGSLLGIWQRNLQAGAALPSLPLPLSVHDSVPLDLERSYSQAASELYLP
jgi:hypothetical protein